MEAETHLHQAEIHIEASLSEDEEELEPIQPIVRRNKQDANQRKFSINFKSKTKTNQR